MRDNNRRIKVLWIDDNPTEFSNFLDDAYDEGLDIIIQRNVADGLKELKDRNKIFEAIILDANCLITGMDNEVPHLDALSHAIAGIHTNKIIVPWFVYTGGSYEGKEALRHIIPQYYRNWDENQWYNKPDQEFELFAAIKQAVSNREVTKVLDNHPEAFSVISSRELLDLLLRVDLEEFPRDETVPNTIRNIMESVCFFLRDNGIYPDTYKTNNKVKECSMLFSKDKETTYVPIYIQRMFHFLSDYGNNGSHESDPKEPDNIRTDIKSGRAKYLNQTGVDALLNVLFWCSEFPINDNEKMKAIQTFFMNIYSLKDTAKVTTSKHFNNQ